MGYPTQHCSCTWYPVPIKQGRSLKRRFLPWIKDLKSPLYQKHLLM